MRPTLLPKPNPRRWNNSDVIVNLEAEDHEGSGVEEIVYSANGAQEIEEKTVRGTSAELRIATEGKTTVYYSAKDIAGNIGEKASVIIGIDKTDPEVHCEKPDDLWHRTDVSIPCTTKDSISGLGDLTDANFLLSTENARERIEDGEEGDSASTNSREICDAAGNCTMAGPIGGIKIDRKSPVIDIVAPPNDAEYKLTEHVEATYACIDSGSGVDECSGSAANGGAIDTSSVGSKSFIVKAKDNAGNSTSESHRYDVVYDFTSSGSVRLQDDPSGLYVAKAGSTVLVEFGLGGYRGSDVFAVGYSRSQNIECPEQGSQVSITESTAQFTKLPNADRYAYAWNTTTDWSGTCRQLVLKLNDGTAHVANFRFTE
jgi:hypothetical protein